MHLKFLHNLVSACTPGEFITIFSGMISLISATFTGTAWVLSNANQIQPIISQDSVAMGLIITIGSMIIFLIDLLAWLPK